MWCWGGARPGMRQGCALPLETVSPSLPPAAAASGRNVSKSLGMGPERTLSCTHGAQLHASGRHPGMIPKRLRGLFFCLLLPRLSLSLHLYLEKQNTEPFSKP